MVQTQTQTPNICIENTQKHTQIHRKGWNPVGFICLSSVWFTYDLHNRQSRSVERQYTRRHHSISSKESHTRTKVWWHKQRRTNEKFHNLQTTGEHERHNGTKKSRRKCSGERIAWKFGGTRISKKNNTPWQIWKKRQPHHKQAYQSRNGYNRSPKRSDGQL